MKTEIIRIADIKDDKRYLLSHPLNSSKCKDLLLKFPFTNFILVDNENRVVFGFEFIEYFKEQKKEKIEVVKIESKEKINLISSYNYKEKFFGFNTYEKLIFIQKALKIISITELYEKVNIEISINEQLKKNLDLITGNEFKQYLISDSINLKSILQLSRWEKNDREIIIDLFSKIPFSKSHQLHIIEMFEELIFKEKTSGEKILKMLDLNNLYKEEKPQKRIIEKIFSSRYPTYQIKTKLWEQNIKKLKLPSNITLTHYPFFEKKDIELKITVKKIEDIEKIVSFYYK